MIGAMSIVNAFCTESAGCRFDYHRERGIAEQNGLLSLNMLLVNGGYERSIEDWHSLFAGCLWSIQSIETWNNHLVMKLRGEQGDA